MKRRRHRQPPPLPPDWEKEKLLPEELYLFSDGEDHPVPFSDMLEQAKTEAQLKKGEMIYYIGSGIFGVFHKIQHTSKKEELQELRRLEACDARRGSWQKQYCCVVLPDYTPKPKPLQEAVAHQKENFFSQP